MTRRKKDSPLKQEKVMAELSDKQMPEKKVEKSTVTIQDTVVHNGIIYRKGMQYEVDCGTKKAIAKHLPQSTKPCTCN